MTDRRRSGRWALLVVGAVGVGLILAPVAFRMFSRAPEGGVMLDEFRPYMDEGTISDFRGHMAEIGGAEAELPGVLAAARDGGGDPGELEGIERFRDRWPDIEAEMLGMLDDMDESIGDFEAVDALPPFPLFPWFFVLPGAILVALAVSAARRSRPVGHLTAVAVVGVGLVAAPAIFQMFARAPQGAEMIDTFRPLMTREKVTRVQGYFLTLGTAEGELRQRVLPALEGTGRDAPAVERWVEDWPRISNEMAPMIGAMADNLDNFAAVDALPRFSLFPWFFVAPGLLVVAAGVVGRRGHRAVPEREPPDGGAPARAAGRPEPSTRRTTT